MMIIPVLIILASLITPNLSDYYNNINSIQKLDDHYNNTKGELFELSHNLFQNINAFTGLIDLESGPRIFNTNTNILQSLSSSQTVVKVITLLSAQVTQWRGQSSTQLSNYKAAVQHGGLVSHVPGLELHQRKLCLLGPSSRRRHQQRPPQRGLRSL